MSDLSSDVCSSDLHAEARTENLLDEVVFFVVESGAAQRGYAERMVDLGPVGQRLDEGLVACLLGQRGDPVHGPIERLLLPAGGVGRAVLDARQAVRIGRQADQGGAMSAQPSSVDGGRKSVV